jgi:hypothetical protein
MEIKFSLKKFTRCILLVWLLLVLGGLGVEVWKYVLDGDRTSWVYFLGLSYERNLPTWYVACLHFSAALLLALAALSARQRGSDFVYRWWLLAAAFVYISLDETVSLHERTCQFFDLKGINSALYFGWVIPGSCVVLIFAILYARFLWNLPRRTARKFMVAGAVFVGGALGVELILGWWTAQAGDRNLTYGLIDLVEEGMEILGVTLFVMALLDYLAGGRQIIRFTIGGDPPLPARVTSVVAGGAAETDQLASTGA